MPTRLTLKIGVRVVEQQDHYWTSVVGINDPRASLYTMFRGFPSQLKERDNVGRLTKPASWCDPSIVTLGHGYTEFQVDQSLASGWDHLVLGRVEVETGCKIGSEGREGCLGREELDGKVDGEVSVCLYVSSVPADTRLRPTAPADMLTGCYAGFERSKQEFWRDWTRRVYWLILLVGGTPSDNSDLYINDARLFSTSARRSRDYTSQLTAHITQHTAYTAAPSTDTLSLTLIRHLVRATIRTSFRTNVEPTSPTSSKGIYTQSQTRRSGTIRMVSKDESQGRSMGQDCH